MENLKIQYHDTPFRKRIRLNYTNPDGRQSWIYTIDSRRELLIRRYYLNSSGFNSFSYDPDRTIGRIQGNIIT